MIRSNGDDGREHRKRLIVFLAPTKVLIFQQHRYIAGNCDAIVRAYTGDSKSRRHSLIDNWSAEDWSVECSETDVMCMTPEIMKNILERKLLPIEIFDCVILDECHHACGKSSMASVCRYLNQSAQCPLILGMTASPVTCKRGSVSEGITDLEATTGCKLVAPRNTIADLSRHVHRPEFSFLSYATGGMGEGMTVDRYLSCSNGLFVGILKGSRRYLENTSILATPAIHPETPVHVRIDSAQCPAHGVYHALARVRLAHCVENICILLDTLCLPDASSLPELSPVTDAIQVAIRIRSEEPMYGGGHGGITLSDLQILLGQIIRICEDCGVITAMQALLTALGGGGSTLGGRAWLEDMAISRGTSSSHTSRRKRRAAVDAERPSDLHNIDMSRYEEMGLELMSSPFLGGDGSAFRGLCVVEEVKVASLLDMLVALLITVGPERCAAALREQDSSQIPWDAMASECTNDVTWMHCVRHLLRVVQADGVNELHGSSLSELLTYDMGSCGVLSTLLLSPVLDQMPCDEAGRRVRLKELGGVKGLMGAVSWACEAVLSSIEAQDYTHLIATAEECPTNTRPSDTYAPIDVHRHWVQCSLAPSPEQYVTCTPNELSLVSSGDGDDQDGETLPGLPRRFKILTAKVAICYRDLIAQRGDGWDKIVSVTPTDHMPFSPPKGPVNEEDATACASSLMSEGGVLPPLANGSSDDDPFLSDDWACIVFCKMRLTVAALSDLLKRILAAVGRTLLQHQQEQLVDSMTVKMRSQLRPCHVLGGFLAHVQDRTLLEFKCGLSNVLFATDVAEEGLDVRVCQRIINFDPPSTVKSYVQRRGRARAQQSVMLTLLPKGEEGRHVREDTLLLMKQEEEMDGYEGATTSDGDNAGDLVDDIEDVSRQVSSAELLAGIAHAAPDYLPVPGWCLEKDAYVVANSGVRVDMTNSVTILNQYCAALPHDKFYSPAALYWVCACKAYSFVNGDDFPQETKMYRCALLLPPSVSPHIRCAMGPLAFTKRQAQYAVALICVRNLHIAGELDDRLRPVQCAVISGKKKGKANEGDELASTPASDCDVDRDSSSKSSKGDLKEGVKKSKDTCSAQDPKEVVNVDVKVTPDFTSPAWATRGYSACPTGLSPAPTSGQLLNNMHPTVLHFYEFDAQVVQATQKQFAESCQTCSRHIGAFSAFGFAFLQPLSLEILQEPINFFLRGVALKIVMRYVGMRDVSDQEMVAMQRFHRSILCWEAREGEGDGNGKTGIDTAESTQALGWDLPVPPEEWARSGHESWYLMFPAQQPLPGVYLDGNTSTTMATTGPEWLRYLRLCAEEAETIISNFLNFLPIVEGKTKQGEGPMTNHPAPQKCADLSEYVYTRLNDCNIYLGGESRSNLSDIMRFDSTTGRPVTFEEYYISKNKLSTQDLAMLREDGDRLVSAAPVGGRLSLVQMTLEGDNLKNFAEEVHSHTTMVDLVPSHCIILGKGTSYPYILHVIACLSYMHSLFSLVALPMSCLLAKWMMTGLVAPSLIWRLHSLLLALEARTVVTATMGRSVNLFSACASSSDQCLPTPPNPNTSTSTTSDLSGRGGMGEYILPSPSLMLTALTPRLTLECMDSERLEFIGDSILKLIISWAVFTLHPDRHEGYLTACRSNLVCNSFQFAQAKATTLAQYIRGVNLSNGRQELLFPPSGCYIPEALPEHPSIANTAAAAPPPARRYVSLWNTDPRKRRPSPPVAVSWPCPSRCSSNRHVTTKVKAKKLADLMEAVVGAFYEAGGMEAAVGVTQALGMWPQPPPGRGGSRLQGVVDAVSNDALSMDGGGCSPGDLVIPPGYPAPLQRIATGTDSRHAARGYSITERLEHAKQLQHDMSVALRPLSALLGYSFSDWSLLDQALTHCSVLHKPSNQRLEYLGDAALDLAVMLILYETSPTATQGSLSALKHNLLANRNLSSIAFTMQLQKYMSVMSAPLMKRFGDMTAWAAVALDEDDNKMPSSLYECKALADCLEAVIGAVFIDSLCSLDRVREVVTNLKIIPDHVLQQAHNGYEGIAYC